MSSEIPVITAFYAMSFLYIHIFVYKYKYEFGIKKYIEKTDFLSGLLKKKSVTFDFGANSI